MGSTRFPGKVMQRVKGVPLIELLLGRLSESKFVDRIVLATSKNDNNQPLVDCVRALGFDVFQGDEADVLDRYYQAGVPYAPENFVRITGDCPLIDPTVVDHVVERFFSANVDYATNGTPPTYPDGL